MRRLALLEPFIALFDTLLAATWVAMACVVAVHAMPPELVADSDAVEPSFDVAMPAPQVLDTKPSLVAASN